MADETPPLDYRALFERSPAPVFLYAPDGTILAASDRMLEVAGVRRQDVVGRVFSAVFPDNPDGPSGGAAAVHESLRRVARSGEAEAMAIERYDVPDGLGGFERRWWSRRNTPILGEDGRVAYIHHEAVDITEYVLQEAARDETTAHLEQDILARSAELSEANQRLREASATKDTFLSRMSHELRTPLGAIKGFAELLTLSDLSGEHAEWSSLILRASDHLLDLVDEVLDIAQIESGTLSLSVEDVLLDDVLGEVLELAVPLAERHEVVVHRPRVADGHHTVRADNQRLKQVLLNLVSNAVKYNRRGGSVTVSADADPDRPDAVRISVRDTGVGLDPSLLHRLYVPFDRLGADGSGVDGTGLGLALSRTLAVAMGGTLGVESTPGTGSIFWIRVPRGVPVPETGLPVRQTSGISAVRRGPAGQVLYIEDTVTNIRLVEAILRRRPDVRLIPAMQGRLGIELAREHAPDLVLLDLHLPDMGGEEVLAALRADPDTAELPVVILSADAMEARRAPLLAAGARDYRTKPIGVEALLRLVDDYVGASASSSSVASRSAASATSTPGDSDRSAVSPKQTPPS